MPSATTLGATLSLSFENTSLQKLNEYNEAALQILWKDYYLPRDKQTKRDTYEGQGLDSIESVLGTVETPALITPTELLDIMDIHSSLPRNESAGVRKCVVFATSPECEGILMSRVLRLPLYMPANSTIQRRVTLSQCVDALDDRGEQVSLQVYQDKIEKTSPTWSRSPPLSTMSVRDFRDRIGRRIPLDCPSLPCLSADPWPDCIRELRNYSFLRLMHENGRAGKRDESGIEDLSDASVSMEITLRSSIKTPRRAPNGVLQAVRVESGRVAFLLWPLTTDEDLTKWQDGKERTPLYDSASIVSVQAGDTLFIPPDCVFMRVVLEDAVIINCLVWDTRDITRVPRAMQLDLQLPHLIKGQPILQCQQKLRRAADAWKEGSRFWDFPNQEQLPAFERDVAKLRLCL